MVFKGANQESTPCSKINTFKLKLKVEAALMDEPNAFWRKTLSSDETKIGHSDKRYVLRPNREAFKPFKTVPAAKYDSGSIMPAVLVHYIM